MRRLMAIVLNTIIFLVSVSCTKLSQKNAATPIDFKGLDKIQSSAGGSFVLSWTLPQLAAIENYGVYIQALDASEAKGVSLVATQNSSDSLGSLITPSSSTTPADKGQLISLVGGTETTFKTPALDEGYYLFQVRALTADGRSDVNLKVRLLQVLPSDSFGGLALAVIEGTNVKMSWIPSPTIRTDENFQYTVYKGPAFNSAVGFTKLTEFTYSMTSDNAGDDLYFGVRITDGQGNEDRNVVIIPVKVPNFNKDYQGCVSAVGIGADRIRVDFQWPSTHYSEIKVFRNQKEVFTSYDSTVKTFNDIGLVEGENYTYTCQALEGTVILAGTNSVKASTLNTNPPTFSGITGAVAVYGHSATLTWGVSTGVPTESYKLYATPSNAVGWGDVPSLSSPPSTLTGTVTGLGDDLQYSFGVRSCGSANCDANTEQLTLTMPDAGAPLSKGATDVLLNSGKVTITAPWAPTDGGVTKRNVYVREGVLGGTVISDYTLVKTILVPTSGVVPTLFDLDSVTAPNKYNIIVRDEDSHGNVNQNTNVVSLETVSLTPPVFNSSLTLAVGATGAEETSLTAYFKAIAPYTVGGGIAQTYRVYVREASTLSACSETYYKYSMDAAQFPLLSATVFPLGNATTIAGLKPKTIYSVCIKVMDKYKNLSNNEDSVYRQTLDTTAPAFDGIQSLSYNTSTSKVTATWNASTSSDVFEYRLTAWLTSHLTGETHQINLARNPTDSPNSFAFDNLVIGFASQDVLEITMNACDNAGVIPGGSQNCTNYLRTNALKLTFADILPPDGFLGIGALSAQGNTVPGRITVQWLRPSFVTAPDYLEPWNDYSGFKIYSVGANSALTLLKDCPCAAINCPDKILTCDLNDLDHYRTYALHVRAYDSVGNITTLDPASSRVSIQTIDTQKPAYTSNLTMTFNTGAAQLGWTAATDDQNANEPNAVITYSIYRKAATNFNDLFNPSADGNLLGTSTNLSWTDTTTFVSGQSYYYTSCASDASGNARCDGAFKKITVPDIAPPVITSFTTTKTTAMKSWRLDWAATDLITTDVNKLTYTIKSKESIDPAYVMTEANDTVFAHVGGNTYYDNITASPNVNTYVHYLLIVADEAGNKAMKQLTVYSQNLLVLTSIRSNEGPIAGSKAIFIVGDGFHSSTTVAIGSFPCGSVSVITPKHLTCLTSAGATGTYTLTVKNGDGSQTSLSNAYKYCTPGVNCTNVCNMATSTWDTNTGQPFAKTIGRGGSAALPYLICNATQLANMTTSTLATSNKYFALGDNINLSGYPSTGAGTWPAIKTYGQPTDFIGFFNGGGYAISNLTYNNSAVSGCYGLFMRIGAGAKVENFGLLNFNITGGTYTGALTGCTNDSVSTVIQDIVVQGNITGADYVGGLAGEIKGLAYRISVAANVSGNSFVGGVMGTKKYGATDLTFAGNVSATPPPSNTNIYARVGGIFGYADGQGSTASNLNATGTVLIAAPLTQRTGGIAGETNNLSISNASFAGTVTCDSLCGGITGYMAGTTAAGHTYDNVKVSGTVAGHNTTGGLIGRSDYLTLTNSTNSANVSTNAGGYTGGLIGILYAPSDTVLDSITNVSNSGNITSLGTGSRVSGLVAYAERLVMTTSFNTGNVAGTSEVGGLIAMYGASTKGISVTSSYNTGNVSGTSNNVGGAFGYFNTIATNNVSKVWSSGSVTSGGGGNIGGLAGTGSGVFDLSYATGTVSNPTGNQVGGFVGNLSNATITNSYATGSVTGNQANGGFVGLINNNTRISKSYSTGSVTGNGNVTGGFVGWSDADQIFLFSDYTTSHVRGIGDYTGGFAGIAGWSASATVAGNSIVNSFARGDIDANSYVGGFIGSINKATVSTSYSTGKITLITGQRFFTGFANLNNTAAITANDFFDKTTSNTTATDRGTAKSTTEMKTTSTFSAATWTAPWVLKAGQYPQLDWYTGVIP